MAVEADTIDEAFKWLLESHMDMQGMENGNILVAGFYLDICTICNITFHNGLIPVELFFSNYPSGQK